MTTTTKAKPKTVAMIFTILIDHSLDIQEPDVSIHYKEYQLMFYDYCFQRRSRHFGRRARIDEAELEAVQMGIKQLFVSTEISDLYEKQGWYVVKDSPPDSILGKALPSA
ncbi:MAG: hypothetical protein ACI9ON_002525 [Limisphaerales bacterium]|jgi:hypothetical protein